MVLVRNNVRAYGKHRGWDRWYSVVEMKDGYVIVYFDSAYAKYWRYEGETLKEWEFVYHSIWLKGRDYTVEEVYNKQLKTQVCK